MSKPTELEKAYFAGFFDGEGYIGLAASSKTTMSLRLIVGQKKPEVLHRMCKHYGGGVYETCSKSNGNCHWYWDCKSKAAEQFIRDIYPYVSVKLPQIEVALEYRDMMNRDGRMDMSEAIEFRERIKSLNSPMGFGRNKK